MKRKIEYLLFRSGVSNYKIFKDTGIPQTTLSRFNRGESDIGRMTLDHAITLINYYEEVINMMESKFGAVTFEGVEYILTQDAYIDHVSMPYGDGAWLEGDFYRANAIDQDGNEYTVLWAPVENYQEIEDGSDHCDWDNPKYVIEV